MGFLLLILLPIFFLAPTENELSIALLVEGDEAEAVTGALSKSLQAGGLIIPPQQMTAAAAQQLNFPNRLNLNKADARSLGLALGSDLFAVARTKIVERADIGGALYTECFIALSFVGTRSGRLLYFDFIETRAGNRAGAMAAALKTLSERGEQYPKLLREHYQSQFNASPAAAEDLAAIEPPADDAPEAEDFEPPVFTARQQPEYTELARKMGISAVVEVVVVLRRDGSVGEIETERWAGFGLDEKAAAAVRQLKFKPATLKGVPVSCRALLRYNFNLKTL